MIERDRRLVEQFKMVPLLAVEDASSGIALLDVIRAKYRNVPVVAAKAVRSKIVRAEAVTPFTTARSVSLLEGEWNSKFIQLMANFPAEEDNATDTFTHAMRCFTGTGSDFKTSRGPSPPNYPASTLTVQTASITPVTLYTLTITGTDTTGSPVHQTTVLLTVKSAAPPPDFSISATPSSRTISRGSLPLTLPPLDR